MPSTITRHRKCKTCYSDFTNITLRLYLASSSSSSSSASLSPGQWTTMFIGGFHELDPHPSYIEVGLGNDFSLDHVLCLPSYQLPVVKHYLQGLWHPSIQRGQKQTGIAESGSHWSTTTLVCHMVGHMFRSRCWHLMWNDSSFSRPTAVKVHISTPYINTNMTSTQ